MIDRLTRSLSFRLLAIFLVMGALFAYGALLGIRWVYTTDQLRDLVSRHLSLHVEYVRRDIGTPPSIANALAITQKVPVDIRIAGPAVNWTSHPEFPPISELKFGGSDMLSDDADQWLRGLQDVEFATLAGRGFLKIGQGAHAVVVSSPKMSDRVVERQLTPIIVGFGLFLVLLAYLAVRWLFKPIEAIRRGAAQIGRGNFDQRIEIVRGDELGDLAQDINHMADDVQRMLDAKRQLLLGISHELRSPLSRMKLALELAEGFPDADGMHIDIDEMEKIIATLLEAERLNSRHAMLQLEEAAAHAVITALVEDYFSRERERIRVTVPADLRFTVDVARLKLMLKNLVGNALRYTTAEDGPVVIEAEATREEAIISVRDHGPGLHADQIEHFGEPFYRGDPSRTRGTGGSGLGLYLARLIAEAHGGRLAVDQSYTDGACLVVTLPLSPGHPKTR